MSTAIRNVGRQGAHIGVQAGVVHGNVVVHPAEHEARQDVRDATPRARLDAAREQLDRGAPRLAESLLVDLLDSGHTSTEIAYYTVLAVLGGRTTDDLGEAESSTLKTAFALSGRSIRDEWSTATGVVEAFVDHVDQPLLARENGNLTALIGRMGELPRDRHAEIVRHLALFMNDVRGEELYRSNAELVRQKRYEGDRVHQAWKFFEPVPAPPHAPRSSRVPPVPPLPIILGGVALLAAFGVLGAGMAMDAAATVAIIVILGASGLVGWSRFEWAFTRGMLRAREADFAMRPELLPQQLNPSERQFAGAIAQIVDGRFAFHTRDLGSQWDVQTSGLKWSLVEELVETYRRTGVPALALRWLIRHRVDEIAGQWSGGALFEFRNAYVTPSVVLIRYWVGVGVVATMFVIGAALSDAQTAGGILFTIGLVFVGAGHCAAEVAAVFKVRTALRETRAVRLSGDQSAHQAFQELLSTKPSDVQMARWLDYDKAFVKAEAMRRCGLSSREVLEQFVLTEAAAEATKARVVHGPPRYSRYAMHIFFMTTKGVREIELEVDTFTGSIHDERRTSFRYDALASARVFEVGVRYAGQRREVLGPDEVLPSGNADSMVLSQAFRLSLVNGEEITVVAENFEGMADDRVEDIEQLRSMALDSSGIAGALRVLEAVAGEGGQWTARERRGRQVGPHVVAGE
jgi:hypothetical protein